MKTIMGWFAAGVIVLTLLDFVQKQANITEMPGVDAFTDQQVVVLELFTSQGCSSCPPADDLLRELASNANWEDKILPLAFHVDYWNYLGWKDPFSRKEWTERQGDYVTAMEGRTMYTPQVVVHGREEMVGSRDLMVKKAIKAQLLNDDAHLVKLHVDAIRRTGKLLKGVVAVDRTELPSSTPVHLMAVVYQRGLHTGVNSGENSGKTLANDYVVRNLTPLMRLQNEASQRFEHAFEIKLEQDWAESALGLAVIAQSAEDMRIWGSSAGLAIPSN